MMMTAKKSSRCWLTADTRLTTNSMRMCLFIPIKTAQPR